MENYTKYEAVPIEVEKPEENEPVVVLMALKVEQTFGPPEWKRQTQQQSLVVSREVVEGEDKWYMMGLQTYLVLEGGDRITHWLREIK